MAGLLDGFSGMSDGDQMGLALAQGLLSARGGPGFAAGLGNMQTVQSGLLKNQLTKAQLQQMAQETQLKGLQLQQAQQQWDMLQPAMKDYLASQSGAGAQGGQSAPTQSASPDLPGRPLGSGTYGISIPGQAASAPASPVGSGADDKFGMRNVLRGKVLSLVGGAPAESAFWESQKIPDAVKVNDIYGLSRAEVADSMRREQAMKGQVNVRNGGSIARTNADGSITPLFTAPDLSHNANITWGPNGPQAAPIPGLTQGIQSVAEAQAVGKAGGKATVSYDAQGNPIYSTEKLDLQRATGTAPTGMPVGLNPADGRIAPADQQRANAESLGMIQDELKNPNLPPDQRAGLQREVARLTASQSQPGFPTPSIPSSLSPQQRPGVVEGAKLGQDELSKKASSLMADNAQTNTVINRLQNIKMLAPGAITGAETSRRDFFNGLLSLADIKGATDAKTASDLVDKNSAQIVSALRMGQGGGGTDALQTLLGAANPNRHMTKEAINEAADQLIASQKMIQDKARVLQPHYLGRDPKAYGEKEMTFDQNADPRVWQWRSITDPQQKKAFAAKVMQSDPTFPAKIQALESIGAIK